MTTLEYIYILAVIMHISSSGYSQNGEVREYCNMETLNAKCGENEVIMMQSARYGRMQLGRCVVKDYGNLGCASDVLRVVDTKCSGMKECSMLLPNPKLMEMLSCPKGVTSYMDAAYTCVKVHPLSMGMCRQHSPIMIEGTSGFLSPVNINHNCEVTIRVAPGQRINVTLIDFGTLNHLQSSIPGSILCQKYATVREESVPKDTVVCSGVDRERNVFISEGNEIKVSFVPFSNKQNLKEEENISRYVLQYEAFGCAEPQVSQNIHVIMKNGNAVVTCNVTGEKWYLVCRNRKWVGEIGRCAEKQVQDDEGGIWMVLTHEWTTPYGILVVIGLGVGLGVLIGVVLLLGVLFFMRRQEKRHPPMVDPSLAQEMEPDNCNLTASLRKAYCPLPVSHQRYDDSSDPTAVYTWRGRNFSVEGGNPHVDSAGAVDTGCNTIVVTRNGSRGNVIDAASGGSTYPRTMVRGNKTEGSHHYELPK